MTCDALLNACDVPNVGGKAVDVDDDDKTAAEFAAIKEFEFERADKPNVWSYRERLRSRWQVKVFDQCLDALYQNLFSCDITLI